MVRERVSLHAFSQYAVSMLELECDVSDSLTCQLVLPSKLMMVRTLSDNKILQVWKNVHCLLHDFPLITSSDDQPRLPLR